MELNILFLLSCEMDYTEKYKRFILIGGRGLDSTIISSRLKQSRKAAKLTQEELGVKVGSTKGTISNYENGHSTPSNKMLVDLADVLGVTTDYLLGRITPKDTDIRLGEETITEFELEFLQKVLQALREFK